MSRRMDWDRVRREKPQGAEVEVAPHSGPWPDDLPAYDAGKKARSLEWPGRRLLGGEA
jgi:hypothetical protein